MIKLPDPSSEPQPVKLPTMKELLKEIDTLMEQKPDAGITLDEVARHLTGKPLAENPDELWSLIYRALANNEAFLHSGNHDTFYRKDRFFNGKQFLITPDGFEIDNHILIAGDRFQVFCREEIFPTEVVLREAETTQPIALKKIQAPASQLLKYHVLMGAEELYDYFIAEDANNKLLANGEASQLSLEVFDMKQFYAKTDFSEGDALLMTVRDFARGEFEFTLADNSVRSVKSARLWKSEMESALREVVETASGYLGIADQLRNALIQAPQLLDAPGASIAEVLDGRDSIFEITFDDDLSMLVMKDHANEEADEDSLAEDSVAPEEESHCDCGHDHEHEHEHEHHHENDAKNACTASGKVLPDGFSISRGETTDIARMLQEIHSVITLRELESFMLDQCFRQEYDFDAFLQRVFGEAELGFADEAQEVSFLNRLEEELENCTDNYPRDLDAAKGELRGQILDIVTARREMFDRIKALEVAPEQIPQEPLQTLAEASLRLEHILALLNNPASSLEPEELQKLSDAIDDVASGAEEAIDAIGETLNLGLDL